MQEPAACGAFPAQHAIAQSAPLALARQGMLPATSVSKRVTTRNALAATVARRARIPDFLESGFCMKTLRSAE